MKVVFWGLFPLLALALPAFGQNLGTAGDEPEPKAEETVTLGVRRLAGRHEGKPEKRTETSYVNASHPDLYRDVGRPGETAWSHNAKTNTWRQKPLAGVPIWRDRKTYQAVQEVRCKNILGGRLKVVTETVRVPIVEEYEREKLVVKTVTVTQRVEVPVDRPVEVPVYQVVMVLAPQQQHIANLPPPTVISPTLNGLPALAFSKSNFRVNGVSGGGTAYGGQGGSSTAYGGVGGGGSVTAALSNPTSVGISTSIGVPIAISVPTAVGVTTSNNNG